MQNGNEQVAIVKAFNGIGLALVVPAIQSLVADLHKEKERGLGFGWLHGAGQFGTLIGGVFGTLMAGRAIGVLAGWRFAFFAMAFVSLLLAAAIFFFAEDLKPPPAIHLVRSVKGSCSTAFIIQTVLNVVAKVASMATLVTHILILVIKNKKIKNKNLQFQTKLLVIRALILSPCGCAARSP